MKGFLTTTATAILVVGGFFGFKAWIGSIFKPDPQQIAKDSYVTECMEARVGWRRGTNGFYDNTTAGERVRMAELCGIEFDDGTVGPVVQAVRDGELKVRGQIDPFYHPELAHSQ